MYDLIILGAGPAALSAAVYAGRYKLNTIVIGKEIGGTIAEAHLVENYLGFKSIKGFELAKKFEEHVRFFNIDIKQEEVEKIIRKDNKFIINTENKNSYEAKSIIITLGMRHRELNVPGEKELLGRGVSYCATCDATFFKDKIVAVIGGADSATTSALLLAEYAKKVYIIYRKDILRAQPINVERVEKNLKIEIIYNTNVLKINGKNKVESIILDKNYNESEELAVDGVFVEIGSVPAISLLKDLEIETDKSGFVIVDKDLKTNIDGVFAAGDITTTFSNLRQAIVAAAEGAVAADSAYNYVRSR